MTMKIGGYDVGGNRALVIAEIGNNHNKTYTVCSAGKIFNTGGNRLGWAITN